MITRLDTKHNVVKSIKITRGVVVDERFYRKNEEEKIISITKLNKKLCEQYNLPYMNNLSIDTTPRVRGGGQLHASLPLSNRPRPNPQPNSEVVDAEGEEGNLMNRIREHVGNGFANGGGQYNRDTDIIVLNQLSIMTYLHEFRHRLQAKFPELFQGMRDAEHDARQWSHTIFLFTSPKIYMTSLNNRKFFHYVDMIMLPTDGSDAWGVDTELCTNYPLPPNTETARQYAIEHIWNVPDEAPQTENAESNTENNAEANNDAKPEEEPIASESDAEETNSKGGERHGL